MDFKKLEIERSNFTIKEIEVKRHFFTNSPLLIAIVKHAEFEKEISIGIPISEDLTTDQEALTTIAIIAADDFIRNEENKK